MELSGATSLPAARRRAMAGTLFGILALLQLLCLEGHINTPDGQVMFNVNRAILERGAVDIPPLPGYQFGWMAVETETGTKRYAKFGLGASLAALPFQAAGMALLPLARETEKGIFEAYQRRLDSLNRRGHSPVPYTRRLWYDPSASNFREAFLVYCATWTNPIVAAAIGAFLFLLGLQFGLQPRSALGLAFASNFLTPLWHYAGEYFAEPLSALGPLIFLWATRESLAASSPRRWRLAAVAGLGLGVGILARTANVIVLPWAWLYLGWRLWPCRRDRRTFFRWPAVFSIGLLIPLGILAAYNYSRFSSVWETGYGTESGKFTTPLLAGLYGLLLSPGRGLLWHHPLVVLSAAGLPIFWRRHPGEGFFIFGGAATYLLFYAKWYNWEGGWCWGPRFLVAAIPLLLLPGWFALRAVWDRGGLGRVAAGLLLLLAAGTAASGVILNYNPFICWLRDLFAHDPEYFAARWGYASYYDLMRWRWEYSPLARVWDFPVRQQPVGLTALRHPGLILALNAGWLLLLLALLHRLARQLRELAVGRGKSA